MADERTKDAILRNLQVIGEASKNLPESLVTKHPEVDWSGLAGVRDIVTHRYFRVDWHLLWTSVHDELPVLKKQIRDLMKEEPE
ncbi:HepT-like ribonuclease domain-containing protein [uncultured Methanoregula sp.]|uniref:HepT-like ribonuclease domain-containing protein n=1 Tax=uncultured Methanoregula sp. TaxID=1005933 RepID=UPI002AAB6EDB|nr:HepT-like ribonuclease domain-containing protein [uncultured Methanoregula sp.]